MFIPCFFFLLALFLVNTEGFLPHQLSRRHNTCAFVETFERVSTVGRPKWAGGGIVSDFINILINNKSIWNLMRPMARNVLISSAEKNDVAWSKRAAYLESKNEILDDLFQTVEDKTIVYPSYYLNCFHGYDDGNLNWLAAYECEAATLSMHIRAFGKMQLSAMDAYFRLREPIISTIQKFKSQMSGSTSTPSKILDVGCSVGVSTFSFAEAFPDAAITGLDLSPHFLAVAKYRQQEITAEKEQNSDKNIVVSCPGFSFQSDISRIQWKHAVAEDTRLPDASYDLINIGFVVHELPTAATVAVIREMFRLQQHRGVLAITDNDPQSDVIQNLPPAISTLMKSTEPFSDEYFTLNIEEAMRETGYTNVVTVATDPRHRTIIGYKP